MDFAIESRTFTFELGHACLIGDDWDQPLKVDVDDVALPAIGELKAGRITAPIERPGDYLLTCSGLSVTRISDGTEFFADIFFAPEAVKITEANLTSGSMAVRREPGGIYAVTLFDYHARELRANQKVSLYLDPWQWKTFKTYRPCVWGLRFKSGPIELVPLPTLVCRTASKLMNALKSQSCRYKTPIVHSNDSRRTLPRPVKAVLNYRSRTLHA